MSALSSLGSSITSKLAAMSSQNISDLAKNMVVGYKFYVFIDAANLAFNRIEGIEQNFNYQTVQEGGLNEQIHFLPLGLENFSTLRFEEGGMLISEDIMKRCFNSVPKEILVLLCTREGKVVNIIVVHNVVISKIGIGPLDANNSAVVVNSMELNYTGFSRIGTDMTV